MNCYFCKELVIDPHSNGILECPTCSDVKYVCAGSLTKPDVWYVHHRIAPFLIEWDIQDNETSIYAGEKWQERDHIFTYQQLLPINKDTVEMLRLKYCNLKAFL